MPCITKLLPYYSKKSGSLLLISEESLNKVLTIKTKYSRQSYKNEPTATRAGVPPSASNSSETSMRWQVKIGVSRSV